MDDTELINKILHEFDGLRLKIKWYFVGELPDGSTMSRNYLINDEKNIRK